MRRPRAVPSVRRASLAAVIIFSHRRRSAGGMLEHGGDGKPTAVAFAEALTLEGDIRSVCNRGDRHVGFPECV